MAKELRPTAIGQMPLLLLSFTLFIFIYCYYCFFSSNFYLLVFYTTYFLQYQWKRTLSISTEKGKVYIILAENYYGRKYMSKINTQ